ncbi:hypothetical protein BN14_04749 [Rhizoctonia solani AG-1 IB]|uniref:Uncharacterized protein n=1 Tax=Thanatephorus cucumeris (strain AG1-IB / isolate 7/3/14) TaxID=1108050 RepID=M5BU32_THACB|nr:hypothetical protein BN14_04749 [Rhizoctonia solani AG-1 IB]
MVLDISYTVPNLADQAVEIVYASIDVTDPGINLLDPGGDLVDAGRELFDHRIGGTGFNLVYPSINLTELGF